MTKKQEELYLSYVFNTQMMLEEEIKTLQDNIRWRSLSYVDCLELIIAQTRLDAFIEYTHMFDNIIYNKNMNTKFPKKTEKADKAPG